MITLAALLPVFASGVATCAIVAIPLAYRAGRSATERDAAEVARILDGVAVPTVRPVPIATHVARPDWAAQPTTAWHNPRHLATHASLHVSDPPAGYEGSHRQYSLGLAGAHMLASAA